MPDITPTSGAKPGILHVLSTTLNPCAVSPRAFATWYENTHIQEVQSTGGISSTNRYESLTFSSTFRKQHFPIIQSGAKGEDGGCIPKNKGLDYEFLTVYQMPDLSFRESKAFRGLDGQREPREELLEGLFRHVEFRTCFAERAATTAGLGSGGEVAGHGPTPFIVTISDASGGSDRRRIPELESLPGCRKVTTYGINEGSKLRAFERSPLSEPKEIVIAEFESEDGIKAAADALGEKPPGALEVGYWGLRRAYEGSERTPAVWTPPRKEGAEHR